MHHIVQIIPFRTPQNLGGMVHHSLHAFLTDLFREKKKWGLMRDIRPSLGKDFSSNLHYLDAKMRPFPKYRWTFIRHRHIACNVDTPSCNCMRCLGLFCTSNVASIRTTPRGLFWNNAACSFCHATWRVTLSGQTYLFHLLKKKWQI